MKTLLAIAIIALIAGIVTADVDLLIISSVITSAAVIMGKLEDILERLNQKP